MDSPKVINFILEREKLKAGTFAKTIGVTPTQIYDLLSGKTKKISESVANKIVTAFPIYNKVWVLTGSGSPIEESVIPVPIKDEDGEFFTENHNSVKFYDLGEKYRMVVKLVPFAAYGRFANECDTLESEKETWEEESFETDKIVHGKYYAFEVKGESMDDGTRNSFEEGDRVLVRELDRLHWKDGLRFKDHPFWVVVFDSSVLIKQIVNQDLTTGEITFHSLNPSPEYSDFTLSMDKIRALYYVLQKKPRTVKY
ncbi:S24 family peptidase [uncultured Bacteroides sp.]|uniref:S24 family peptidase n=1 Tax=uncultured Bacteroides sp. TaxID=162156 RepID=UPI002625F628|nr:S24 family peptidase [uncultured Bacteroides sp.]